MIEFYLRREGFEVETATDGETAFKAVEHNPPDLAVVYLQWRSQADLDACMTNPQVFTAASDTPIEVTDYFFTASIRLCLRSHSRWVRET